MHQSLKTMEQSRVEATIMKHAATQDRHTAGCQPLGHPSGMAQSLVLKHYCQSDKPLASRHEGVVLGAPVIASIMRS
jgi:hypothetical protein